MSTPLISILMPVFNAERTVKAALRSILAQTVEDWELIVIDDGSQDATLTKVRSLAEPRIKLIDGSANLGLAVRLNQAIALSGGRYLARMDADDIAYPERFATQVKFMLDHPECDLVGAAVLIFDDSGAVQGKFPVRVTHEEICAAPWSGFPLPHPTWFGKRTWFVEFGYRPDYKKTQDQDALLRAYAFSRFACVPQVLLGYRQEKRTLKKLLGGRLNFSRSIVCEARKRAAWREGIVALAGQGMKALADALTVPFGLDRRLRGESRMNITSAEVREWRDVWTAANMESGTE